MNLSWFKNSENILYREIDKFSSEYESKWGLEDLRGVIEDFRKNPIDKGLGLRGGDNQPIKLIIPDMIFDEHIPLGENVWVYLGEEEKCFCLYWNDAKEYKFFNHSKCEYFPCHETNNEEDFNCLFCYCPLYALGENCGGNFIYGANGIKDCSNCKLPHKKENYDYIMNKFGEIVELTRRKGV